jgi:hypothetical protein
MKTTPKKAVWSISAPPFFIAILFTFALISAYAAESNSDSESQTEKLVMETQNPVANLISVPFQNNFSYKPSTTWRRRMARRLAATLPGQFSFPEMKAKQHPCERCRPSAIYIDGETFAGSR